MESKLTNVVDPAVLDWLLASPVPSIRYLTTLYLKREDPSLKSEIMRMGPMPAILAEQTERGSWAGERSYYTPKYVSTHWSMLLAAELAADGADPRLRAGAEFMLAATREELEQESDRGRYELSCFWGNLLRYATHCGFRDDPRVQAITDYVVRDGLQTGWRCRYNDGLACAWGCARALWGLAAQPATQHGPRVRETIDQGIDWLLNAHKLVEAEYPTSGRIHPLWFRLNFPLFYQVDILFVLRVLTELGMGDHPGAAAGLDWLARRQIKNGRWRGANPYRRRTWAGIADGAGADRWATLYALLVLNPSV
jgi:hypothetical protein